MHTAEAGKPIYSGSSCGQIPGCARGHLGHIHEPVAPVRLVQVVVLGVLVDLREVELRRVPAADPVVRPEVPLDLEVVGLALVPLGEDEHVLAVLVSEPGDRHLGVQRLVVPGEQQLDQSRHASPQCFHDNGILE